MAQRATGTMAPPVDEQEVQGAVITPRVDYGDERFAQVEEEKQQALTEMEQTYGSMISQSDRYYQQQIDASKQWAEKQQQLQQEQTDFAIEQINQQKAQAQKDYTKEQSGSYADWQKNSDAYGVQAEQLAGAGLKNTGYSESSQVAMYTAYQNRVAVARDAHARAVLNYDNAIKDAQLQNNSALAEIAYQALQKELELSLSGFQYKNTLILEQANKKVELENTYYGRYLDVLNQINYENEQAESIRQYEQSFAEQVRQYQQSFAEDQRQFDLNYQLDLQQMEQQKAALAEEIRQFNQSYNLQVKEYNEGVRQFNAEIARLKAKDAQEHKLEIQRLEQQKKALQQEQSQFEAEQKLKEKQLAEQKRQYDAELAYKKQQAAKASSGGSSSKSSGGSATVKKTSGSSSGSSTVKSSSGSKNTSTTTFDNDSLIKAGVNPYVTSEAEIARLVANGQLSYKQVGNKLVFSRGSGTAAAQATLNKYTYTPTKQVYK